MLTIPCFPLEGTNVGELKRLIPGGTGSWCQSLNEIWSPDSKPRSSQRLPTACTLPSTGSGLRPLEHSGLTETQGHSPDVDQGEPFQASARSPHDGQELLWKPHPTFLRAQRHQLTPTHNTPESRALGSAVLCIL